MRIILGTDFSENAARAGNVAAALANRLKDTLLVLHTLDSGGLGAISPKIFDTLSANTRADLDAEAGRLRKIGPTVKAELLTGSPDGAIVKKAAMAGARLVVVSSLGKRAPERWLLGSVSQRIAQSSPVPTLVVRQDESLAAWADQRRPLRVLCAYDFTATADAALAYVKELRQIGSCDVVVAQVDWPLGEKARLGIPGDTPPGANHTEVQAVLERDLKEKVVAMLSEKNVSIRVEPGLGRADFRLIEIARTEQADLIVTGTHQWRGVERLWHASTSRGLLHYAPMNVLVVPAPITPSVQPIPSIRRVLVATDFSASGNNAIPHAYATLPCGGTVKLIYVISAREKPGQFAADSKSKRTTQAQDKRLDATSLQQLRALVPPDAEARGIVTEVEVVPGRDAATAIDQTAERFGADVICLGSHGRSGFSKAVLGSVAQKVMAKSRRPVLLVRKAQE